MKAISLPLLMMMLLSPRFHWNFDEDDPNFNTLMVTLWLPCYRTDDGDIRSSPRSAVARPSSLADLLVSSSARGKLHREMLHVTLPEEEAS